MVNLSYYLINFKYNNHGQKSSNRIDCSSQQSLRNEDFLSNVYLNQDVRWNGVTNDNGYSVTIDSIFNEPESRDLNFFDVTTIYGTGGRSGNATAKVKNDSNLVHKLDKYTINFSVYADGRSSKSFHIDPKLAANP